MAIFSSEIVLDISSTVVDESKEIVLFEFASVSSNVTLSTSHMSTETSHLGSRRLMTCL